MGGLIILYIWFQWIHQYVCSHYQWCFLLGLLVIFCAVVIFFFGFIYIVNTNRSFWQIFFKNVGLIESEGLFDSQVTMALFDLDTMVSTVALFLFTSLYISWSLSYHYCCNSFLAVHIVFFLVPCFSVLYIFYILHLCSLLLLLFCRLSFLTFCLIFMLLLGNCVSSFSLSVHFLVAFNNAGLLIVKFYVVVVDN